MPKAKPIAKPKDEGGYTLVQRWKKWNKPVPKDNLKSEHNLFTHFPKDPNCSICNECKCTRSRCSRTVSGEEDSGPIPKEWGDALTADHAILNEDSQSRYADQDALVVFDRGTSWLQSYPVKNKSAEQAKLAFQKLLGPDKPKSVYTDNSKGARKST